jgi:predicted metal-dependent phosphoesterase TrpH
MTLTGKATPLLHSTIRLALVPRDASRYYAALCRLSSFWWLLAVAGLVLASAPFALSPVRDAVTGGAVPEVSLRRSPAYVLLAPLSDVLDVLTLLSVRQHVAVLLTLVVLFAIWWWWRGRIMPATVTTRGRRIARIVARIGVPLVALLGVYAAGVLLPRPMAALDVSLADVLTVDFHSHTRYSHDGRPDWTPEDNRAWHRDAGFGAAYITDHRTFEGARDAWANNPPIAAEGVELLPGIEVVWKGEHVNVLDADRAVRGLLDPTQRDIDEEALRMASLVRGAEPVLVETIPGDLSKIIPAAGPGTPGIRAIEVVDGAPRGLGQSRRERARIIHLADSLNLALVAGSDHHGWGHTAAGWTLMYVPGWRGASPENLAKAITTLIRAGGKRSTKVVERYVAYTETGLALPLTAPVVVWGMMRTLSTDERVVWIAWALAIFLLMRIRLVRDAR